MTEDRCSFYSEEIDRITKVVELNAMSMNDCADILEMIAPLCNYMSASGAKKILKDIVNISIN